jgi:hypothetical protein
MSDSLSVNIDIKGLDLLRLNKQQVEMNRFLTLERNGDKLTFKKSAEQLRFEQDKKGKRYNGTEKNLLKPKQDYLSDRPTAPGTLPEYMLMLPTSGPVSGQVPFKSRGFPKFGSVVAQPNFGAPIYEPTGGPNGAAALACEPDVYKDVLIEVEFPYEGSTSRYKQGVKDFTLQAYAKLTDANTFRINQPEPVFAVLIGNTDWVQIDVRLETNIISLRPVVRAVQRDISFEIYRSGYDDVTLYRATTSLSDPTGPQLMPGAWHHLAISKSGSNVYAFFDGAVIGQATVDWDMLRFSTSPDFDWGQIYFGTTDTDGSAAEPVRVHGLKFEARAVYTAPFTPPPFIT